MAACCSAAEASVRRRTAVCLPYNRFLPVCVVEARTKRWLQKASLRQSFWASWTTSCPCFFCKDMMRLLCTVDILLFLDRINKCTSMRTCIQVKLVFFEYPSISVFEEPAYVTRRRRWDVAPARERRIVWQKTERGSPVVSLANRIHVCAHSWSVTLLCERFISTVYQEMVEEKMCDNDPLFKQTTWSSLYAFIHTNKLSWHVCCMGVRNLNTVMIVYTEIWTATFVMFHVNVASQTWSKPGWVLVCC